MVKKNNCFLFFFFMALAQTGFGQSLLPHLKKTGNRTQLIVKDRPFLVLGGELGNSTATSMENMQPVWQRLKDMNLNTVLVPVYWELVEPRRKKV
jgi:hypothetical protein